MRVTTAPRLVMFCVVDWRTVIVTATAIAAIVPFFSGRVLHLLHARDLVTHDPPPFLSRRSRTLLQFRSWCKKRMSISRTK